MESKGWRWMALKPDKPMKEEWAIRCDSCVLLKLHEQNFVRVSIDGLSVEDQS